MASRKKTRNNRVSSGGTAESQLYQLQQRVKELEFAHAEKDDTIQDLKDRLRTQTNAAQKLRKERDELRSKNATLVTKLAEISRKNSVNFCTTPPR